MRPLYAAPVFRIVDLMPEGQLVIRDPAEATTPPPADVMRWLDVSGNDAEGLERLRLQFGFHPLAIEDCLQFDQRPKLEEYKDHLFLVTQGFSSEGSSVRTLQLHELHAFLGKNYLVTVHSDPLPALEQVWTRVSTTPAPLERGVDFVYYLIADRVVDENFPILDRLADELEELEDRVLGRAEKADLARIFELKRHLVMMRKVLSPQRDTMAMLARRGDPRVSERTSLYFRDVHDHLARLNESIEANRDLLSNALDAYLSAVSNRTNEIMKHLTLLSAVFLPLAFIVGFFGQNFDNLLWIQHWQSSDALMHAMLWLCVLTPIAMLLWFRFRRWI
jgi:magnesium transporter